MAKLSKEMIDSINSYEDNIKTIEDYVSAIRQTIGYHLGSDGTKGHLTMIKEILQNSFDEAIRDYSPCNFIKIVYDERTFTTLIEDNGRGIPFNSMIRVFTEPYTSSNYEKKIGDYSAGVNGSGGKITLALSSFFNVESYILGNAMKMETIEGKLIKELTSIPNKENKQGTIIMFAPSAVMGNVTTTVDEVYNLVFNLFPLVALGTTIDFVGIDKKGNIKYDINKVNTMGISGRVIEETSNQLIKVLNFGDDNGTTKVDIAFSYDAGDLGNEEVVHSYSNFCLTLGGTHKDGFLDGIIQFFKNYMNKIYLASTKSKLTIVNSDIKTGLKAVVNAAHLNPIFNGQAKEILRNEDMYGFVKNVTLNSLQEWSKNNPNDLQKLCKFFKDVADLRNKSEDAKVKISNKYQTSFLSGKPKKFLEPSGNNGLELIIVEGDSALGSAKNSRCNKRQGLFPIKGKIPNAFSTEKTKFLSNQEIASMISIIGGGYGKSFDISKVKWDKVITMADADPDGSHINSLLLRFFLLYMPDLIKAGKLYKSVPPLYGIRKGNTMMYFTNKIESTRYIQTLFAKNNVLTTLSDIRLTNMETITLFINCIDYLYEMGIVSTTYAINPLILEDILLVYDRSYKEIKKYIEGKYRFIKVKQINGTTVIDGLDGKYHTIFINDKLIEACVNILEIRSRVQYDKYKVNGEICTLYQLMELFENSAPANLKRFKGLGEQNPQDLAKSALHPDGDRVLIRYTIEDIVSELETIKHLESNKNKLLENISITRQDIE